MESISAHRLQVLSPSPTKGFASAISHDSPLHGTTDPPLTAAPAKKEHSDGQHDGALRLHVFISRRALAGASPPLEQWSHEPAVAPFQDVGNA